MFLIPLRLVTVIPLLSILTLLCMLTFKLFGRGKPTDLQVPIYNKLVYSFTQPLIRMMCFCYGMYNIKWVEHKISDYLAGHKKYESNVRNSSMIIANHKSFFDFWVLMCLKKTPAFLAKSSFKGYPFIGTICTFLQSIYVNKRTPEGRKKGIDDVNERLKKIDEGENFPSLL